MKRLGKPAFAHIDAKPAAASGGAADLEASSADKSAARNIITLQRNTDEGGQGCGQ